MQLGTGMEANRTDHETGQALFERVQAHLAAGGEILVATQTRATLYKQKHASYFRASRRAEDLGIYVRAGKREDYLLPSIVRFV